MSAEENKQLVLRWKEAFWNGTRNLHLVDEFFAPDIVCHMTGTRDPVRGREAFKQLVASLVAAFDQIQETPEFLVAEGDLVVIREIAHATHTGAFQGIPPTGKRVSITNNEINRIVDGTIVEQWVGFDMLRLVHQLGVLSTPGHGTPAPTEANTALVRRFAEEILNEKRFDRAEEIMAQDYVDHGALPGQAPGLEGFKQKGAMWVAAVPDLRVRTDDMFAEGDRVAARWAAEGTHQGTLLGIPPSGRRFQFGGLSIFRVAAGKIAEQWEEWDKRDLLQQLGVLPAPAPAGQPVSSPASNPAA